MKSVPLITGGLSFLLSACSGGGGSFDVDDVSNPSSSKPRYQDDTSSSRTKSNLEKLSIPSLGGGMKLVAQNLSGNKEPSFLNENGYISYFSSPSTIEDDVKNVKTENKIHTNPIGLEPNRALQDPNLQKYVYSGLYYIENWKDFSKLATEKKAYSGHYGYAFYYGNKTATDLPVSGVATYKGTWDFITATKYGQNYSLFSNARGQAYFRRSATRGDIDLENNSKNGDIGLISEFSADFGTKKLTGQLSYTKRKTDIQQYEKEKLYDIDAHIYSNRFRGKVTPTKSTSDEHPFTSEGTLEGGFYGPNAEELGGKFLARDKRVFGVFSAKETPETEKEKLSKETLIDGKLITFSTKTADATTSTTASTTADVKTDEKNFTTKDISSFGEADYLLIDNYPVPLFPEGDTDDFVTSKHHDIGNKTYKVEACCKNLSYVKFGMYYEDKEKKNTNQTGQYHQFLLGLRTPSSQIPVTGNVKYLGSWFGYIGDDKTSYSTTGNKQQDKNAPAEFDVNFDNKTLTGKLKRADSQNTVFNIEATFKNGSNAFEGKATANVVIDPKNTQATSKVNFTTTVNGAFYGPHATELGGYFTYNGNNPTATNSESSSTVPSPPNSPNARAAVVFGAKRQVEKTNK
ncbi:transferrin-binding protein-like solute binding protein [Haemophilus influenzae]|uniref:Transferrin-binding protein B n=1 Tax=Haemophilus influenzae (strain 86-028NP) TaxID=281310 RepID=TBPB_HAEI8|nr:transferrin-binding protein-like solute binding protein [Haemophilus influenzae]Q4QLR5.1 RecName: Full=Transferrin-binding protein B; Short=TbpB; AltName: Full=Transferrin-binding protein 2; Flags: Precursor [Haemophilus influenzae 86-028NP]AAX88032.1 transferrin-binding protein 2 [Haemophilus influenzae 86-028NP]AXP76831.1 transferrin-binding protein-like solute binding protein [Haemophilus influenzae]KIP44777.1 transferrin-binding protein 2 [Haemophilus influenzae]MBZ5692291.1 transferrin